MTLKEKWLIIGVSGVTCGGKTTLSTELNKMIPSSIMISQDDYFLDVDDSRHTWIPELNHINFDITSSLDMDKMYNDIMNLIKTKENVYMNKDVCDTKTNSLSTELTNVTELTKLLCKKVQEVNVRILILEGFCIFNHSPVADLCCLKYYFTLTRDECYKRRIKRVYEPPDCPGYFEKCVWPEYLNLLDEVKTTVKDVEYFDGTLPSPIEKVLLDIYSLVENWHK
ncbi:hypothetical protein ILUMI_01540 [Ignelater luminosus]|uniref:Phosphoribulokinase/uridine kinase domain-containing protein n=1 Tax=Ignelater luminosus TaxID=2038154 RepID=A0A8K0GLM3_IGNLU|nr:hypothetical protein ILUMI_01540 [Ignelater luminosus]